MLLKKAQAEKRPKKSLSHWVEAPSLRPPSVAWVPAPVQIQLESSRVQMSPVSRKLIRQHSSSFINITHLTLSCYLLLPNSLGLLLLLSFRATLSSSLFTSFTVLLSVFDLTSENIELLGFFLSSLLSSHDRSRPGCPWCPEFYPSKSQPKPWCIF